MIVQCADCKTRYQLDPDRVPREPIRVRCPKCTYVFVIDGSQRAGASAPASAGASGRVTPMSSGPAARVVPGGPPSGAVHAPPEYGDVDLDSRSVQPSPEPVAPQGPVARGVAPDSGSIADDFVIERSGPALGSPSMRSPRDEYGLESPASRSGFTSTLAPPEPPRRAAQSASRPVAPVSASVAPAADPQDDKARRLARALVSDILVYNRETRDRALAEGNLVQAMGQEIKKSWELYKEKVTPEVANRTNHFREALNEILANGQQIF